MKKLFIKVCTGFIKVYSIWGPVILSYIYFVTYILPQ